MNETKHNTNQGRQPGSAHFVSRRHFIQTTAALARVAAALTSGLCLLSARSREASAGAMAAVLFSVFTAYAATDATNQPVIIFDTDMGSDVDDARTGSAWGFVMRLTPGMDGAICPWDNTSVTMSVTRKTRIPVRSRPPPTFTIMISSTGRRTW